MQQALSTPMLKYGFAKHAITRMKFAHDSEGFVRRRRTCRSIKHFAAIGRELNRSEVVRDPKLHM